MFLVNRMPALFLFDLGATRLFVSLALSKKFDVTLGAFDFPLDVEIAYDHTLSASMVHMDYVLEIF